MSLPITHSRPSPRLLAPALGAWFLAALGLSAADVLGGRAQLVPVAVLGLTATLVAIYRRSDGFRAAVDAIDTRALILLHVLRAPIGIWFLILHARGVLPGEFAIRGGWGDILAGLGALAVAALVRSKKLVFAWNVFALLDIVVVVATGMKLAFVDRNPIQIAAFSIFPVAVLPFFIVPIVLATHVAIFARLRK